jgi:quercetin dioxygenase-like cupin family protein
MRQTTPLREGAVLVTKEMKGTEGAQFPAHTASLESVLVVMDGSLTITLGEAEHQLGVGDTFVVPADVVHTIVGTPDFTAVHVMPKDIRFDFRV